MDFRIIKSVVAVLMVSALLLSPSFGSDTVLADIPESADAVSEKQVEDIIIETSQNVSARNTKEGILLEWKKDADADHYRIFRRKAGEESGYEEVKKSSNNKLVAWIDKGKLSNGSVYNYLVAYCKAAENKDCIVLPDEKDPNAIAVPRLEKKKIKTMNGTGTGANLTWNVNGAASGYQIQFTTDPFFFDVETFDVEGGAQNTYNAELKKPGKKHYARMRAYKTVDGVNHYSPWTFSPNYKKKIELSLVFNKKKKKRIDYRAASKQKMWGYDTFQGACSNGVFSYNALVNKSKDNAKIIKVNIASGKVVKIGSSKINGHVNSMTYNTSKKIIVTTGKGNKKLLNVVDPAKLKTKKVVKISIPSTICGISKAKAKKLKGISAISYIPSTKKYLVRISEKNDFAIMNSKYVIERYIEVSKSKKGTRQSVFFSNDLLMNMKSPSSGSKYNIMDVYDNTGVYITTITLKNKNEVEDVYTYRNRLYGQIYRSYMKKIKVKQKVTVKTKKKKKKVITKEVEKRVFWRGSNIFRAK